MQYYPVFKKSLKKVTRLSRLASYIATHVQRSTYHESRIPYRLSFSILVIFRYNSQPNVVWKT